MLGIPLPPPAPEGTLPPCICNDADVGYYAIAIDAVAQPGSLIKQWICGYDETDGWDEKWRLRDVILTSMPLPLSAPLSHKSRISK
jgi:hypothetical protein